MSPQQRFLCIRLSGLGDVVHALNALSLLRRERPDAFIAWAVEERFAGLLRGHPHVDRLIEVPRRRWGRMLRNPFRWGQLRAEVRELGEVAAGIGFDASLDFQSSLKSVGLVRRGGAALKIGFERPVNRELNRLFQHRLVAVPREGIHRIERDLALLEPLGIRGYADPVLAVSRRAAARMETALAVLPGEGPLVVIHPGTSEFAAFKRWLPERYAEVADALAERRGADALVSYGPADRPLAEAVVEASDHAVLAPPTADLQELVHLLGRADLFIGGDTGPMHLASAAGTPVAALFGPKDPAQTGPFCSRSIVVEGRAECRPCTRRRCPHLRCMTSIAAEAVLEAALQVLDGGGERRAPGGDATQRRICYHDAAEEEAQSGKEPMP